MKIKSYSWALFVALLIVCSPVSAQTTPAQIDITQLTNLYNGWLDDANNEWINQRIVDEREEIRKKIESEITTGFDVSIDIDTIAETELVKSQEKQKQLVEGLKQRLRERTIDLQLLDSEEKNIYLAADASQKEQFKTTNSHAELLAKRAVLEERVRVLESLIPLQENRLGLLTQRQRIVQFGVFINIGMVLLILLAVYATEKTIRHFLLSKISNDNKRYTITKSFTAIVYIILTLIGLGYLFAENPNIITSFAIVGAGIAVALQDVIKDIMAWIFIARRTVFSLGDRITIGAHTGEVIDVGMLRFTIQEVGSQQVLEHTGKTVTLPNSLILHESVINHSTTSDFVKAEIRLVITFESNRQRTEQILLQILEEETEEFSKNELRQHIQNTRQYYLSRQPAGMKIYKNIVGSGYEYTLRYTVPIGMQRSVTSIVTEKIMDAIDAEPTVHLAYDTIRIVK